MLSVTKECQNIEKYVLEEVKGYQYAIYIHKKILLSNYTIIFSMKGYQPTSLNSMWLHH